MITRHYLISGRVQGVFFRDSTRKQANELKLSGWVRNLVDGRVECLILGNEPDIEIMEKWLKTGPKYAKVSNIVCKQLQTIDLGKGFHVRPTASLDE